MTRDEIPPELVARVEALSGPDREVDALICAAIGWVVKYDRKHNDPTPYYEPVKDYSWQPVPHYTVSLDAAMTLANGKGGEITFFKDGTAKAFLWQPYPLAIEAKGATPALALTAACLKLRAKEGRDHG